MKLIHKPTWVLFKGLAGKDNTPFEVSEPVGWLLAIVIAYHIWNMGRLLKFVYADFRWTSLSQSLFRYNLSTGVAIVLSIINCSAMMKGWTPCAVLDMGSQKAVFYPHVYMLFLLVVLLSLGSLSVLPAEAKPASNMQYPKLTTVCGRLFWWKIVFFAGGSLFFLDWPWLKIVVALVGLAALREASQYPGEENTSPLEWSHKISDVSDFAAVFVSSSSGSSPNGSPTGSASTFQRLWEAKQVQGLVGQFDYGMLRQLRDTRCVVHHCYTILRETVWQGLVVFTLAQLGVFARLESWISTQQGGMLSLIDIGLLLLLDAHRQNRWLECVYYGSRQDVLDRFRGDDFLTDSEGEGNSSSSVNEEEDSDDDASYDVAEKDESAPLPSTQPSEDAFVSSYGATIANTPSTGAKKMSRAH